MKAYYPYFEPLGITYPQYLVLLVLWEQDKQPVNDIAKRLMLDTNTVTPLLQRMEKTGLIDRKRGEKDMRQRIVSLTEKGRALYEQAVNIPACIRKDIAASPTDEETFAAMIPALDNLINNLQR